MGPNPRLLQTLSALMRQTLPPHEIILSVPKDLDVENWGLPSGMGFPVRFVKAQRGMISQRAECIIQSSTEYILLMDDDIVLPETFIETVVNVAMRYGAQCVVPYVSDGYPRGLVRKWFSALFLIAVPSRQHGIGYLASGGFRYPKQPMPLGAVCETDGGMGAAVLLNRDWAMTIGFVGDYCLEHGWNPYSLREDSAFIFGQKQRGARVVMVNAGEIVHLGGTTRLDQRRRKWAYEALIHNHLIFWRRYVLCYRTRPLSRLLARAAVCWHCLGIVLLAIGASIRAWSLDPIEGVVTGAYLYLRRLAAEVHQEAR